MPLALRALKAFTISPRKGPDRRTASEILADLLCRLGYDAIHTLDLPAKNTSTDHFIIQFATEENRIVVTKDSDFLDSFLLTRKPEKLILVRTGNIKNQLLLNLFAEHHERIRELIRQGNLVEITTQEIITHS